MTGAITSGAWAALTVAAPPAYRIESKPVKKVDAILAVEFHLPNATVSEWVIVGPEAPETGGQRDVRTEMVPAGRPVPDAGALLGRLPVKDAANRQQLRVEMKFHATLVARKLVPARDSPAEVPALAAEERKRLTADAGWYDHEAPAFRDWLTENRLTRRTDEGDVAFARRVFQSLGTALKYEYTADQDRRASQVCRAGRSDCGGMAAVYVAALRASGVPARSLGGRMAQSAKKGEQVGSADYYQEHVRAEFFADGVGWVPADPAAGVGGGGRPSDLAHFGNDAGDFLTLSFGGPRELEVRPLGRQKLDFVMQGPAYWFVGTGNTDGF